MTVIKIGSNTMVKLVDPVGSVGRYLVFNFGTNGQIVVDTGLSIQSHPGG